MNLKIWKHIIFEVICNHQITLLKASPEIVIRLKSSLDQNINN